MIIVHHSLPSPEQANITVSWVLTKRVVNSIKTDGSKEQTELTTNKLINIVFKLISKYYLLLIDI